MGGSAWSNQPIATFTIIIESGVVGAGLFVYSGTPAAGNDPVVSIAAPGTTQDPFGNPVTPILTIGQLSGSYVQAGTDGTLSLVNAAGVTVISLHPASGKLQFFDTASGVLKMLVQENSISGESAGTLAISSGVSGTGGDVALGMALASLAEASGSSPNLCIAPGTPSRLSTALLEVQGGFTVIATAAGGQMVEIVNNASSPTLPTVILSGSAANDLVLGAEAAADVNLAWKMDNRGKMQWGPGNAALDTSLYRAGAGGELVADPIACNKAGSAETWQAISFASSGLTGTLRVKLMPLQSFALIDGTIAVTLGASVTTYTFGSLPSAAYYPVAGRQYPIALTNTPSGITANDPRIFVPSSGAVQMVVPSGSGNATASFTQLVPLD